MRKLFHPAVSLIVRWALGGILIYASFHKITEPPDFAKIVFNYKLFPSQTINLLAIYMPWVEVFVGLALITGLGRRGAAFLASLMFLGFIAVLSYNLYRGCPTICGCFDSFESGKSMTEAEKFAKMRREILLDVGLVLLATHSFIASFMGKKPPSPDPS